MVKKKRHACGMSPDLCSFTLNHMLCLLVVPLNICQTVATSEEDVMVTLLEPMVGISLTTMCLLCKHSLGPCTSKAI